MTPARPSIVAAADYAVDGDASARKTALTIADLFR